MYSKPSGVGPESLLSAQDPGAQSPTCLHSSPRCRRLVFIQSGRRVPSIGAAMVEFQSAPDKTRLQILRPARSLNNVPALIQRREAAIGIGLQDAAEVAQMPLRMLALAIGRIAIPHRRRISACGGAIIAHVSP